MIIPSYKEKADTSGKKAKVESNKNLDKVYYYKIEEEIYHKESSMSHTYTCQFPGKEEEGREGQMTLLEYEVQPYKTILTFPASKSNTIVDLITKLVQNTE
jgi:hypothetical protein